jgi:Flp pilus assembly protein TadG
MRGSIRHHWRRDLRGSPRAGTILAITAIVLIALVGLLGLVIDTGQLMTAHRMAQNAGDAGATAAAMDMMVGKSNSVAIATATSFVQQMNGLTNATVVVNIGPGSGPHAHDVRYVEVLVSNSASTRFIQVLGNNSLNTVTARAVAGQESVAVSAGVIALDKGARPGINLSGNGTLRVNGTVLDNSDGGGLTATGQPINNGSSGNAISTNGNGALYATDVQSVGGVNNPSQIKNFNTSNSQSPLHTGAVVQSDPYQYLPSPTTANGAVATNYGTVSLSGNQNVTLSPGVYSSISVSANVNVTLNPGIYIIAGGGLSMSGNATLHGNGVMLYNTGSNYNVNTGLPDSGDGNSSPPAGSTTFGGVSIAGNATINVTPVTLSSSPFTGLVLYQRRLNTQPIKLSGNGSSDVLMGTVYAKWASLDLSGNGTFNSQFVVQSLDFTGNGTLTLDVTGQTLAKSNRVFLVE